MLNMVMLRSLFPSHLAHRAGVLHHHGIGREQRNPLDQGLRDQEAVERVLVDRRQPVEGDGVLAADRRDQLAQD